MQYNFITGPVKPKTVTVITPTVGSAKLADALRSVQEQTYQHITHLVVVDGYQFMDTITKNIDPSLVTKPSVNMTITPYNTGANGLNGQRIYAAYPHLVDTDYVFFLDEDNWYEPNHVETLVNVLQNNNEFAFSLRKVYNVDKQYLCEDNCESLGKWPIWFKHDSPEYLIDTSSYAFRKEFIQKTCQLWHTGPWGEDRRYLAMVRNHARFDTSGLYTLCYRLDGNANSVSHDFFKQGNEEQRKRYGDKYPWVKEIS